MPASFPTTVKSFTTKAAGGGIGSDHVNDLQLEVIAIETELKKTTGSIVDHGGLAGLADNDHPQYVYKDGYVPVTGTWTYLSASTVTVPSGAAAIYKVGQGVRLTQSTVKYFYIVGVADTVLTLSGGSNYTLVNAVISAISYTNTPGTAIGFPVWFAYTPTYQGGWTAMPSGTYRFNMHGKHVNCYIAIASGTSNSVEAYIGLPTNADAFSANIRGTWGWGQDNGTQVNPAGGYVINTSNHTIRFFKTSLDGAVWTASGTKRVSCPFFYEAA